MSDPCLSKHFSAPQANKPFQTLSMIYEDLGDMQKSLQVSISVFNIIQFSPFIIPCLVSIGVDCVIRDLCYTGTVLQWN